MSNADRAGSPLPHYKLYIGGEWCEGRAGPAHRCHQSLHRPCLGHRGVGRDRRCRRGDRGGARDLRAHLEPSLGLRTQPPDAEARGLARGRCRTHGSIGKHRQRQDHPRDSNADGVGGTPVPLLRRLCRQAVGTPDPARSARCVRLLDARTAGRRGAHHGVEFAHGLCSRTSSRPRSRPETAS